MLFFIYLEMNTGIPAQSVNVDFYIPLRLMEN